MQNVYLTSENLNYLKEIGKGTDGIVFQYQKDTLIKIYHHKLKEIISAQNQDPDIIKIFNPKEKVTINNYEDYLTYFSYSPNNDEHIRILPKYAIDKAIERRDNINLTSLPIGKVYLNNHLAGCILERQKGIQIHKLIGMPMNIKKRIFLNVLKAIAELLKNNIYHIDLANSPFVQKLFMTDNSQMLLAGHSHILVNPLTLKTSLIDLDGKSTIYTEIESPYYKSVCFNNLYILAVEFLFQIDWDLLQDDPEYLASELKKYQIPGELIDNFINKQIEEIDSYFELVRALK